jgi:hypothetical protein
MTRFSARFRTPPRRTVLFSLLALAIMPLPLPRVLRLRIRSDWVLRDGDR